MVEQGQLLPLVSDSFSGIHKVKVYITFTFFIFAILCYIYVHMLSVLQVLFLNDCIEGGSYPTINSITGEDGVEEARS